MLMEFKVGDRVHVTRLDGEKVDFYATLTDFDSYNETADIVNCTDSSFEGVGVYLPNETDFGPDKIDYYTLATDEEDTEEPVIQRTNDMYNTARSKNYETQEYIQHDPVNKPSHYNYGDIEVIDYCDQVCKQYPSDLAPYVFNTIKYLSRSEYKNGKEDVAKAKFYIQRLFDKWDDSHE